MRLDPPSNQPLADVGHFDPPDQTLIAEDIARALREDLGSGDVTADLLANVPAAARVVCKHAAAVIAGRPWFDAVFHALDASIRIDWEVPEGAHVTSGRVLCRLHGRSRALLSGERTALNFLQTLSATATTTAAFVAAVGGTRARILDTRKTLPGLRQAQKYAVRVGGGCNHRMGLFDAMMLKENHILAAGSLTAAVAQARARHPEIALIVEVESLTEFDEALAARPDRILLDEFSLPDLRQAVQRSNGTVPLEVSGGVGLQGLREIAETGVDCISVGALTKNIQAIDLSMRFDRMP